jgi:formylglycine-generating enzyme required for sulfatase activity
MRGDLEQIGDAGRSLPERLAAGQALGLIGDPRYPVSLSEWRAELGRRSERFGQPDGYWSYVHPGAYQIGAWKEGQAGATLTLAGFWIGRFPITVAQFAPFVEEGYAEDAQGCWTPQGWNWRSARARTAPEHWDDPGYTAANQPVIGLSWYEATAYCVWLSARLGQALPPGYVVRLPTEAEWEAAAAFDHEQRRHPYPWGHAQPTPDLAIYNAFRLLQPAPVGCCPAGMAACGALDIVGNVAEWCDSWFGAYPAGSNRAADDPPSGGNLQLGPITPPQLPTRGGWWAQDGAQLGCWQRLWHYASTTSYSDGFRVVLAAPLADHRDGRGWRPRPC